MARPVRVVVDSTADFSLEEADQLGIAVVPLLVRFGDEVFRDRYDLSPKEFYSRLVNTPKLPETSQPPPAAFQEVFRRLLDEGSDIIAMLISSSLSGTYNVARLVAEQLAPERITVIDTKLVTFAAQVLVRQVHAAAQQGAGLAELQALFDELFPLSDFVGALDTLEYLRRGGRIGRVASVLGTVFSVKPLVTMRDGVVAPLENVRTRQRSLNRAVERILAAAPYRGPLLIGHANDLEAAEWLAGVFHRQMPDVQTLIQEMGPVVGTHSGPGTVGAAYIRDAHA